MYRRLMQKHHPNARSTPQALERLRELNEAWRVLSDPAQRAAYDAARGDGEGYQPPTPPPTPRALPTSAQSDFGARRSTGGTCLVAAGVALALVFALGILGWGVSQQLNLAGIAADWQQQVAAALPALPTAAPAVALSESTPTPDPRCRDGCVTPPAGCVVKGDVQPDGSRFFYLPNDEGYGDVVVDLGTGDRWFCALNDAQSAGWTRRAPTATPTVPPPPEAMNTVVARRAFLVCGDNVAVRQGPGDDLAVIQTVANGARLTVVAVNGAWSVVSVPNGTGYVRTEQLCIPTRAAAKPTQVPVSSSAASPETPTVTPAAIGANNNYKYPPPQLVSPSNGSSYSCNRPLILEWTASILAPGEFFLVESKPPEREQWAALADWTTATTVTLNPARGGGGCDALWWANTGVYEWRVSIVSGSKTIPTYLAPFSEPRVINYAR